MYINNEGVTIYIFNISILVSDISIPGHMGGGSFGGG